MGHTEVRVLDGGLPKWRSEGRAVEDMEAPSYPRHFTPRQNHALVRDFGRMLALQKAGAQIVDAAKARRASPAGKKNHAQAYGAGTFPEAPTSTTPN